MAHLAVLAQHGVRARVQLGGVLWIAPKSAITDDLRKLVREHKLAIIRELRGEPGHLFPKDGDWPFTENVPPEAIAQVDAIRDRAMELGWTEAGLYQNRGRHPFPYGQDYGLVCCLSSGRKIGEVTRQHIEIVCRHRPEPYRFYNSHVPQPWAKANSENHTRQSTTLSEKLR